MDKHMKIFNKIKCVAEQNQMKNKHGCALVFKNKIYNIGINHSRTCYNINNKKVYVPSSHAEFSCIINFIKNNNVKKLQKMDLYVMYYSNGKYKNSKPCFNCIDFIKNFNINKIIYTTGLDDIYVIEKVQDITTNHVSKGWKKFNLTNTNTRGN